MTSVISFSISTDPADDIAGGIESRHRENDLPGFVRIFNQGLELTDVALVLPVVSLATLMTMNLIGLAIHQMSVTGLIVALGLLVDAAIVMTDEVGKRLTAGDDRAGAVAGAVAGVLVLGIGLRLAMRVVAITDPTRTPEFSVGGTAFILVGIGVMLGAFAGAYLGGLRHLLGLQRVAVAIIATIAMTPILKCIPARPRSSITARTMTVTR